MGIRAAIEPTQLGCGTPDGVVIAVRVLRGWARDLDEWGEARAALATDAGDEDEVRELLRLLGEGDAEAKDERHHERSDEMDDDERHHERHHEWHDERHNGARHHERHDERHDEGHDEGKHDEEQKRCEDPMDV
eukprot:9898422-Heterocapsa_arctica.AAC.1